MNKITEIKATNIDAEKKRKAVFVLKSQGKNLSEAVRETIDKYAKQFEDYAQR